MGWQKRKPSGERAVACLREIIGEHAPGPVWMSADIIEEVTKMRLGRLRNIGFLVAVIGLAACAPNAVINPVPLSQMNPQAEAYAQKGYVIVPGDTVDIKFAYHAEYNELALPVRPDGHISLQFAPDIMAAGLTPGQLRAALMKRIASELNRPEIAVNVRTFAELKVFVDGEVMGPRLVELKGATTVMMAIAQAGGLRETARLSNVIVIRKDFEGKPAATMVDVRKIIDGSDMSQNIALIPLDIVYVPKSNIARIDKFVDEYITRVIPGLGGPLSYYWTGYQMQHYNN